MLKWVLACCLQLGFSGCARWDTIPEPTAALPRVGLPPDSVMLDIAVVHVPADLRSLEQTLWTDVDEQHLPNDLRRRLWDNGMRCALAGTQLPDGLRRLLDRDESEYEEGLEAIAERKHQGEFRSKLYSRTGKRYKIVTTPTRERIVAIIKDDGYSQGTTCEQAHCEFSLRTFPQGDGGVRLVLTPEIHFGPARPQYVGEANLFILDKRQESIEVEPLQIQTDLLPGQTLLLSATPELIGLGRHFFAEEETKGGPPKIVMIRLSQTQFDDLFEPGQIRAPIATPTD